MTRRFTQVDVFTDALGRGNAVAVVHDAEGLDDDALRAFARWTQLSETTFLLAPTPEGAAAGADYRVRIFTPGRELPFAGHPTLGSARAWLEAGGVPRRGDAVVQECGAGLVTVRRSAGGTTGAHDDGGGEVLAFEAPPLVRSGPVDPADLVAAASSVGVRAGDVLDAAWVDNGPGWVALLLADADAVLAAGARAGAGPDDGPSDVGLVGLHAGGAGPDGAAVEVRAFVREDGAWWEDPVTGSLNAGVGQWLTSGEASVRLPDRYTASQGTALGRRGRVHVAREGERVWVGGATVVGISGSVAL